MEEEAKYQISASRDGEILEILIAGEITARLADAIHNEVAAMVESANVTAVLIDVRDLQGRLGAADTYYRVRSYRRRHSRLAVVDIPENAEFQSFYETTARNAGLCVKGFTQIQAAKDWLRSTQTQE